jgi:hypothetical protein
MDAWHQRQIEDPASLALRQGHDGGMSLFRRAGAGDALIFLTARSRGLRTLGPGTRGGSTDQHLANPREPGSGACCNEWSHAPLAACRCCAWRGEAGRRDGVLFFNISEEETPNYYPAAVSLSSAPSSFPRRHAAIKPISTNIFFKKIYFWLSNSCLGLVLTSNSKIGYLWSSNSQNRSQSAMTIGRFWWVVLTFSFYNLVLISWNGYYFLSRHPIYLLECSLYYFICICYITLKFLSKK